ncbi:MAG: hypothetical protein EPO61_03245 [Nitrospirae bacterium]|nr:MAG: hypothetical protein EPO61_03245 [Nitrospirota bacterium]
MRLDPREIVERLMVALGLKTQAQLAGSLEIRPQSIVSAINRGEIPDAWLYRVAYQTGRSVEWLRTGKGPAWQGVHVAEAPAPAYGGDKRQSAMSQQLNGTWDKLDAEEQAAVLRCAEIFRQADREIREHLIAQLKLIDEMAQARRAKRAGPERPGRT